MKKYEVLLFDLDDTLIDNLENVRYAYTKMVNYMNEDYTLEGFKKWYELDKQFWIDFHNNKIVVPDEFNTSQELFVKYVRSLRYQLYFDNKISLEKAFEINDLFLSSLEEVVIPIDGSYETLEYLNKKYKIVIATNGPSVVAKTKLEKIGCYKFIDSIFSADMTSQTVTKPKKEFFDELEGYLNFYEKDKMLIIGDSLRYEIKGGMNAGIDSIWYNAKNEVLSKEYAPTYIIKRLSDLKDIL